MTRAPIAPGAVPWLRLSIGAALLAVAGNIVGLSVHRIYEDLTAVFLPQALAQDIASLAVVAPLWLVTAVLALRGSSRAYLLWLGALTFTVYNYVIYTFSVPFGSLFPLWVAVLGLSLYALIGGVASVDHDAVKVAFADCRTVLTAAWVLIVVAILFVLLWLSEDMPALLSGSRPKSVVDMALPTNPVHILDFAFFLPAVVITGALLIKEKALGYTLAPALIVFLVLTGVPILITPLVQAVRGETAAWAVTVHLGALTVGLIALLVWMLRWRRPGGDVR